MPQEPLVVAPFLRLAKRRVLVVDDYPDTAESMCTLLELLGHDCRSAGSGRAALAEIHGFDPDLVLLDLGLPDLSGYEVAQALRKWRPNDRLHIVAMTGWGHQDKRRRALAAGCDDYVIKPATGTKLREILSSMEHRDALFTERSIEENERHGPGA